MTRIRKAGHRSFCEPDGNFMYTIDASAWINSFDERETGHEISEQLLDILTFHEVDIFVPNLVFIEIASAGRGPS